MILINSASARDLGPRSSSCYPSLRTWESSLKLNWSLRSKPSTSPFPSRQRCSVAIRSPEPSTRSPPVASVVQATTNAGKARGLPDDTMSDLKALFADSLRKVKREQQDRRLDFWDDIHVSWRDLPQSSINWAHVQRISQAIAHGAVRTPAPTLSARQQPRPRPPAEHAPVRLHTAHS